jgi:hypothetical protein
MKLSQLPPQMRKQAAAQLASMPKPSRTLNASESAALSLLRKLTGTMNWKPCERSFDMSNGHKYTPDCINEADMLFAEVKGWAGHHSKGRSRLAFDQCCVEFVPWVGLWVERRPESRGRRAHWRIETL